MNKPTKPNITIPKSFAANGEKNDFNDDMLLNGFDRIKQEVVPGDALNKFIDDSYQGLNYSMDGVDDLYKGIVLYSATETYNTTSLVFNISEAGIKLYHSLVNNNKGNSLTDATKWEEVSLGGSGAYVGQSIFSFDPLDDDTLHLPNGDLLRVGGIYDEYITKYIANLFVRAPHRFCTQEEWQASVEQYGVCSKYVYTEGVSVRLPKVTGIVEGTLDANALGEIVEAGLPPLPQHTHSPITLQCSNADGGDPAGSVVTNASQISGTREMTSSTTGGYTLTETNSIWGKTNKVQPQTILGYMYIVVATGAKTDSDVDLDLDNIVTDLNGKVDKADLADCSVVTEADAGSNWWYRIWSADNTGKRRYEEGGYSATGTGSLSTISFLRQFSSKPSVFVNCQYAGSSSPKYDYLNAANVTTSSFQVAIDSHGTDWWATGYID